ncbi:MAG TPA: cbb3-type cytochrome oxidase assembly protein CcoS [Gemmatimonadales bacterium]|nr:cbb3-type cytochrome oxidase assembly protein CcoS [Gemmatimonadales bacterium]
MSVIYVLVPVALVIVAVALWAYVWAARKGQFDDLETPAMRVLHEDDGSPPARRRQDTASPEDPETGGTPPR